MGVTLMKSLLALSLLIAAAVVSAQGVRTDEFLSLHDARPEAIGTGTALLVLASLLRRGLAGRRAK